MNKMLKYILCTLFTIVAFSVGYTMFSMNQLGEEWGYFSIPLLLFSWGVIWLLFEKRFSKMPHKWKLFALATIGGLVLAMGFPPVPLTFLMFIGFVPFLIIEDEINQHFQQTAKWEVAKYMFHGFLVWNILSTYWVCNTAFVPGIVAIVLNSIFMTIPWVLFHQTKKVLNGRFTYLPLIAYWLGFEYVHLNWEISWPWLTLGNAFAEFHSWVQWYEYTGVFGGSLWILLSNILIFSLWKNKAIINAKDWLKLATVILMPIGCSLLIYHTYEADGATVEVTVVQPNYNPHYEKFTVPASEQLRQYIRLSESKVDSNTNYLVFPETSFWLIDQENILSNYSLKTLNNYIKQYPKLNLVTGVIARKIFKKNEPLGNAIRTRIIEKDTIYYEMYNASIQLSNDQTSIPFYKKSRLVPGAEIMPYNKFFFFLKPIADKLGGSLAGHGIQDKRTVFTNEDGVKVGTMICYESIYGGFSTGYVKEEAGANFLTIITNDGWWDNTAGFRQHLRFASLRAIEYRRSIARSAITGSSCFINQRGDIRQATDYEVEAVIKDKIILNDKITFYTRWGDLIGRLGLFAAIIFLLNMFAKGWLQRRMDET